jgi:hypothetical protein
MDEPADRFYREPKPDDAYTRLGMGFTPLTTGSRQMAATRTLRHVLAHLLDTAAMAQNDLDKMTARLAAVGLADPGSRTTTTRVAEIDGMACAILALYRAFGIEADTEDIATVRTMIQAWVTSGTTIPKFLREDGPH